MPLNSPLVQYPSNIIQSTGHHTPWWFLQKYRSEYRLQFHLCHLEQWKLIEKALPAGSIVGKPFRQSYRIWSNWDHTIWSLYFYLLIFDFTGFTVRSPKFGVSPFGFQFPLSILSRFTFSLLVNGLDPFEIQRICLCKVYTVIVAIVCW